MDTRNNIPGFKNQSQDKEARAKMAARISALLPDIIIAACDGDVGVGVIVNASQHQFEIRIKVT